MNDQISILLADDDSLVRAGIRAIIEADPGLRVVAEASDGAQVAALLDTHRVDVVLLDVRMPRWDGLRTLRELQRRGRPERVIMLTTFDLDEYVVAALEHGASGFVLKASDPRELGHAIRAVLDGGVYLAPRITKRLIAHGLLGADTGRRARARSLIAMLTERERDVLAAVAEGMSNLQIARRLAIAEGTVKVHVSTILAKLDAESRVGAALIAVQSGEFPGRG